MRKTRQKMAVLETGDIVNVRRALAAHDNPLHTALFEWLYTNGARASEPGQAGMRDVDMRAGRVMLVHLKGGLDPTPIALASRCKRALAAWFDVRADYITEPQQREFVFPSRVPGKCYPCKGTGTRHTHKGDPVPCHHCGATGRRWGVSRYEVAHIVRVVLEAGGVPPDLCFPHVLRHSAVTHMLDAGWNPADIRQRVGHKSVETTFGYMQATKRAQEDLDRALGGDDEF